METIKVGLQPIFSGINLPTVIKTAILPGEHTERLFIATQVGEIYYKENGNMNNFLDIRSRIIKLGTNGGYDERGLLGLAFHPNFSNNGLFYLHYSVAGTKGPGALPYSETTDEVLDSFAPNPCDINTLNLKWINRETQYDHIDTVEEWIYQVDSKPLKRRTLLNLRRPFMNHNGVNSLNFSPETGKLVLSTGDGGSGYDPFNLAQVDMEIPGKIIEIDVDQQVNVTDPPVVTRFNELPLPIQYTLTIIVKGGRNYNGISYLRHNNQFIKYVGNVGQHLVESIYSFIDYKPVPVTFLVQKNVMNSKRNEEDLINLGWRGWEGSLPTLLIKDCPEIKSIDKKITAFYDEMIDYSTERLRPLTCYYHQEPRVGKFSGSALTGVKPYMGTQIPNLTNCIVFTDWSTRDNSHKGKGVLAYTPFRNNGQLNDYGMIEIESDSLSSPAYYVSLGTNSEQTKLYLGVYGSTNVTDYNQGTVFEIVQ
ncbi:PQQ-dependent sugar dehydrogenase [Haloplasma contractile]|uniref:Glucose dehydrogenase pyrroloquinoline-quinone protein n=1 Tax=Haloplasma contractile SSD-17B TaxID=1033810 RepID=U2FKD6_9MOLU|nr:PQQ-dependent sugar dehydrogenase [Haloplasma contractile]ERJ13275.1 Glucose dehydrogenase pyrroloquinoline-quinone protein [Haloplasma contractile SSD-17B]